MAPAAAHATCYEPGNYYPPVTGTTHIESVSPQAALPGVTPVYIQGYCFGDSQGNGTVTLNGETMTDIVFWTDAEIEFIPPDDATSGNLVVTSQSYGTDSTSLEAGCVSSPPGWCGNDSINATFAIATVNAPTYWLNPISGTPSYPQYVQGTWDYADGSQSITLTLNQLAENSNGTWPITGTEVTSIAPGQVCNLTGTLDQYGDIALYLPVVSDNDNCIEWTILGSGDVTSQGLGGAVACTPPTPPVPTQNFLDGGMDSAEGSYYQLAVPPLFKSLTDKPTGETPAFTGTWATLPGSTLPTASFWQRAFPVLSGFVGFAGRFVYEQPGGAPTDGCYFGTTDKYPKITANLLTGGGWYVDQNGGWGDDAMGISSQVVSYYQNYYGPQGITCEIVNPQALYISARGGAVGYIIDTQMPAEIMPEDLIEGIQPGSGPMVTACEVYPRLKGKCK